MKGDMVIRREMAKAMVIITLVRNITTHET